MVVAKGSKVSLMLEWHMSAGHSSFPTDSNLLSLGGLDMGLSIQWITGHTCPIV